MCTTTLNNLKENIEDYVYAATRDEKVHIATDQGSVVLISEEYLRSLEETLYLNSIPGLAERILDGRSEDEETFTADWENEL